MHTKKIFLLLVVMVTAGTLIAKMLFSKSSEMMLPYKAGASYSNDWRLVDSLVSKGLPVEALSRVEMIRKKSIAENNYAQFIKTLVYNEALKNQNQEDKQQKIIAETETETAKAPYPVKPVLQSMLAQLYWNYYETHRYQIIQRTHINGDPGNDIATWDALAFGKKAGALYMESLKESDSLQHTDLGIFNDILHLGAGSKNLRPTLYEFLANRAIAFFASSETDIEEPADKFIIDDARYLGTTEDFLSIRLKTTDSIWLLPQAVKLMQDVARFNIKRNTTNALIDAEITRLNFALNRIVNVHKDSLYLAALQDLELRYPTDTLTATTGFEIASHLQEMGNTYSATKDTSNRWLKKHAIEKCIEVEKRFPGTTGAYNCASLVIRLMAPQLSFKAEHVSVPEKPFKILVNYTNADSVYLVLLNAEGINPDTLENLDYRDKMRVLMAAPLVRRWSGWLPASEDHQAHSTEIPATSVKKGSYYLVAATKADFNIDHAMAAITSIQVSDLGYVARTINGKNELWIHDRTTGKAIAGATVTVSEREYDQNKRKYVMVKKGVYTSDADGIILHASGDGYKALNLKIEYKGDKLTSSDYESWYNRYENEKQEWTQHVFFFLDRGIYRPGQTLHFKGLCLKTKGEQNKIDKAANEVIQLLDANGQKVAELKVTANDFGTFAGTFTLPASGLNGEMSIETKEGSGQKSFRVEDYKRPQFEVSFQPIKGSFRLGDKVSVTGKATGYSGVPVDGANVKYHVERRASFPYWYGWGAPPYANSQEIISAKAQTDANGEFKIDFTAVPDASVNVSKMPEYTYSISADVTDINSETQSATSSVTVGAVALRVSLPVKGSYDNNDTSAINIITQNLNGEFEAAKGTIQIFQLKDNGRITRNRPWERPDQFSITEKDFQQNFPLDIYKDEEQQQFWAKGAKVFDLNFDSEKNKKFYLPGLNNWNEGQYVAELNTHDKFGVPVTLRKYFTVYNLHKKDMPLKQLWWIEQIKPVAEPGEAAQVLIGSSEKDVSVLYEVQLRGQVIYHEWIKLNNEKKLVELPIKEEYRGNINMSFRMVKDERVFTENASITVPYSNKELKLEFTTFRDKLIPGAKEEWKIKIKGPKGEKAAAEMLAEMYDASLDAFVSNPYYLNLYSARSNSAGVWRTGYLYQAGDSWNITQQALAAWPYMYKKYDQLNWFIMPLYYNRYDFEFNGAMGGTAGYTYEWADNSDGEGRGSAAGDANSRPTVRFAEMDFKKEKGTFAISEVQTVSAYKVDGVQVMADSSVLNVKNSPPPLVPRTNFSETAFFYPQLQSDSAGNVVFSFTMPDALTRWKFQAMAHTQDLKLGFMTANAVTQKDLMITPNAPRFLREGDDIEFTAKISSLSDKDLSGKATLSFSDPYTNNDITNKFGANISPAAFTVKSGQSGVVSWKLKVPEGLGAVSYKVIATAGSFSDGEEAALPILSNRMLITETLPVHVKGGEQKTFMLEKLISSSYSKTLTNHKLTFELTSNPVWYAIQSLPYLMEFPHECSEQLFNRFYANSMATNIANSSPRIQQVFKSWKDANALQSNLEKNSDLKQVLLEETPWVMEGHNETERKKRVGLLFDLNKMSSEQNAALKKLIDNQSSNGGWPWFKGMPDNRYITQYIVTGIGRLQNLGIIDNKKDKQLNNATTAAIKYLDARIAEDYNDLIKYKADLTRQQVGDFEIQYLYARSYFKSYAIPAGSKTPYDFYLTQAKKYWHNNSKYSQAMTALILYRAGDVEAAENILRSLKETATTNEELGMYWIDNVAGYYCFEAPVETQALMIEAFSLDGKNQNVVDDLRTWLLKQKQVQDWKTTKATSDACYALLLNGSDWLSNTEIPQVTIGNINLSSVAEMSKPEAGTGYVRTSWDGKDIKSEMGKVTISKQSKGIAWGALYWQYFEQLDKVTGAKTPLQLNKKLFLHTNTANGPVLTPITTETVLNTGDLVTVRIELRSDREMDFVQMKDMRASGFEPTSVLSSYKYQGGLGYYESPRDASTNFFFDHLNKGTFVFEYTLRVSQKGNFSNGITTIQSMYAPEFSSHSEGIRVVIK